MPYKVVPELAEHTGTLTPPIQREARTLPSTLCDPPTLPSSHASVAKYLQICKYRGSNGLPTIAAMFSWAQKK